MRVGFESLKTCSISSLVSLFLFLPPCMVLVAMLPLCDGGDGLLPIPMDLSTQNYAPPFL